MRISLSARIKQDFFFFEIGFCLLFFNFHLIGPTVNHRAGIFKASSKTPNSKIGLLGLLCLNFNIQSGSLSTWMWHVPRSRSGPRQFVRCRRLPQEARSSQYERQDHRSSRSAASESSQHSLDQLRRLKNIKAVANPFFMPSQVPKHTSTNQVTTSIRSSIAVSPSLLPAWGFGASPTHSRDPKRDSLLAGAGKTICRQPRRSGEDACRRSPLWLSKSVP